MKHWHVVMMTVFVGAVAAASCATGSQIESSSARGTGGETSAVGTGGAGGTSAAQGTGGAGGTSAAQGTGGATTSSAGGGGGAPNPCEGVLCNTPPPNECDGSDLKVYATVGTCDTGACTYGATTESCPNGCSNGACLGDPCIGVSCNNAPPPTCADPNTLKVPQAPGSCSEGTCTYLGLLVACPFGCSVDHCQGDPCAGVVCNQPAANYCVDATHVRVRDLPGTCDSQDGMCDYTTHDEYCAFGCTNGACNNDPCVGVICPPKASYCSGPNTVVHYDAGQCINGLPCSYGSMSVNCPNGCVNGQCVGCTMDAQCGTGKWCSNNQCQACSEDLHCGASCVACGGATPKCNGAACVQCLTDGQCTAGNYCNGSNQCATCNTAQHCGAACAACSGQTPICGPSGCVQCLTSNDCNAGETCGPANTCMPVVTCMIPTTACTTGGSQDGGCTNAYRISRLDAGTTSGFTVNNNYGLCNRTNHFTTGNCGGSGSDAEYRLFMRKGETAAITLTRGNSTCTIGWAGAISLKVYEAACNADCSSCPVTCNTIDYCVQNNNQNTNFVAPNDGWYTIVVDSVGPVEDKGGVFYLNVKLTCAGGNCACP